MIKEKQTSPEDLQQSAVKLELPADLLTQLEQVKVQAEALSGGNPNWLCDQMLLTSTGTIKIPYKWDNHPVLFQRAQLLRKVLQKNPEWGKQWANKFYIGENSFEFPEIDLKLCIDDSRSKVSFDSIEFVIRIAEKIPTKEEMGYVWNFISTSGNIGELREFLGLKEDRYWLETIYDQGDGNYAYYISFQDGTYGKTLKDNTIYHRSKY